MIANPFILCLPSSVLKSLLVCVLEYRRNSRADTTKNPSSLIDSETKDYSALPLCLPLHRGLLIRIGRAHPIRPNITVWNRLGLIAFRSAQLLTGDVISEHPYRFSPNQRLSERRGSKTFCPVTAFAIFFVLHLSTPFETLSTTFSRIVEKLKPVCLFSKLNC